MADSGSGAGAAPRYPGAPAPAPSAPAANTAVNPMVNAIQSRRGAPQQAGGQGGYAGGSYISPAMQALQQQNQQNSFSRRLQAVGAPTNGLPQLTPGEFKERYAPFFGAAVQNGYRPQTDNGLPHIAPTYIPGSFGMPGTNINTANQRMLIDRLRTASQTNAPEILPPGY
jgi:hypothetical protein